MQQFVSVIHTNQKVLWKVILEINFANCFFRKALKIKGTNRFIKRNRLQERNLQFIIDLFVSNIRK